MRLLSRRSLLMSMMQYQRRPNILFIMSDDHAAQAISAYGSKINKTPNIDRLAREGVKAENCFCTNSICTPSR
ncbi:MAG: sulfatase-like hydrolase/transferase, partial [Acidobacteriota bacterium]